MIAEIITIGDEILTGLTVNSNAAAIGAMLTGAGVEVRRIMVTGDDEEAIVRLLDESCGKVRLIVSTGGLGPTNDDVTRKAAARFFGTSLVLHQAFYARLKAWYERRGRISALNEADALLPEAAELVHNPVGMMPGLIFETRGTTVFFLPGVPAEMDAMMRETVIPRILRMEGKQASFSRRIRTIGIAESELYRLLQDLPERFPRIKMAFLPSESGTIVRVLTFGGPESACRQEIDSMESAIRERCADAIYGFDDETLERVTAGLLHEQGKTLAVAESCTGGLISHKITQVPGSSLYFKQGLVVYSNEAKIRLLGIPEALLNQYGAVSRETAEAMAGAVRMLAGTDIGLSVTGIAGPGGGTKEKPVGTVHMACAVSDAVIHETHRFFKDRSLNKERFAYTALNLLRKTILKTAP